MKNENSLVKYWVGDLCYVMHDVWDEVCSLIPFDNSEHEFELEDGRKFILFNTAYGDGSYEDQKGNQYSVDAGVIGAIKVDDIRDPDPWLKGGNVHSFPAEIDGMDCYYDEGEINIYTVSINTGYEEEEEEEEEEE